MFFSNNYDPICMNTMAVFLIMSALILASDTHISTDSKSTPMNTTTVDAMTYPVKNISVSINKPAAEVYRFASNSENFPKWIAFIQSIAKHGDTWTAKTDLGNVKIKFATPNDFGIIDHYVTLTNGQTVYNPMRVIANNQGCEFAFTLLRMPDRTEDEFNEDAQAVTADLKTLKRIMEN